MSTDTKYQVMAELLDIHPAALEKAEEQASRIIEMVKGEGRFAPVIRCPNGTGVDLDQYLEEPASVKVQPVEFTTEDLSYLKDRGHTWIEIAAEAGITPDAARKRVEKWRKKQPVTTATAKLSTDAQLTPPMRYTHELAVGEPSTSTNLYEPGCEEARQEAAAAEATIQKSLTVEEQIGQFIRCMILKDPNAMDFDILQAVKRNFPGISLRVADIRSRRQVV